MLLFPMKISHLLICIVSNVYLNMKTFIKTAIRYSRFWDSPTRSVTATVDSPSKIKKFLTFLKLKLFFVNNNKNRLSTTKSSKTDHNNLILMDGTDGSIMGRIDNHYMIVGLGNHGFPNTRHSIGMKVIDRLVDRLSVRWEQNEGYVTSTFLGHSKLTLFKPKLLMNVNGSSVAKTAKLLGIVPSHIYLIHDELDRLPGKFHLKEGGSAGGHNGVLSCMNGLKSKEMMRLRIGIGRPTSRLLVVPYVLGKFPASEMSVVDSVIPEALDHMLHHIEQRTASSVSNLKLNDKTRAELKKHTSEANMKDKAEVPSFDKNVSGNTKPLQEKTKAQNFNAIEDNDFQHKDLHNSPTEKSKKENISSMENNSVISETSKPDDISRLDKEPVPDR